MPYILQTVYKAPTESVCVPACGNHVR